VLGRREDERGRRERLAGAESLGEPERAEAELLDLGRRRAQLGRRGECEGGRPDADAAEGWNGAQLAIPLIAL
jgi:hypothetical protein